MKELLIPGLVIAVIWVLAYQRAPAWLWTVITAVGLLLLTFVGVALKVVVALSWIVFVLLALLLNPGPIRRAVFGAPLLALFRKILPQMSATEKEALDAGTVWW